MSNAISPTSQADSLMNQISDITNRLEYISNNADNFETSDFVAVVRFLASEMLSKINELQIIEGTYNV